MTYDLAQANLEKAAAQKGLSVRQVYQTHTIRWVISNGTKTRSTNREVHNFADLAINEAYSIINEWEHTFNVRLDLNLNLAKLIKAGTPEEAERIMRAQVMKWLKTSTFDLDYEHPAEAEIS
jgi:hypothetical protein